MENLFGAGQINKFGFNPDIDTGTAPEDIWRLGGVKVFPTTAGPVTLTSTSDEDAPGGTGMSVCRVFGLDENWDLASEDITMNGTSGATGSVNFIRMFRGNPIAGGTNGFNVGAVTAVLDSKNMWQMPANLGSTQLAIATVPRGNPAEIKRVTFFAGKPAGSAIIRVALQTRIMSVAEPIWATRRTYEMTNQFRVADTFKVPIIVEPQTDIRMRVISTTTGNVSLSAGFEAVLFRR